MARRMLSLLGAIASFTGPSALAAQDAPRLNVGSCDFEGWLYGQTRVLLADRPFGALDQEVVQRVSEVAPTLDDLESPELQRFIGNTGLGVASLRSLCEKMTEDEFRNLYGYLIMLSGGVKVEVDKLPSE